MGTRSAKKFKAKGATGLFYLGIEIFLGIVDVHTYCARVQGEIGFRSLLEVRIRPFGAPREVTMDNVGRLLWGTLDVAFGER